MDLYPTLCEIAGIPVYHEIDGISLASCILENKPVSINREIFFMRREGGKYGGLCYYAARKGPYKLVQNTPFEAMQLFNLETDPGERIPLDENSKTFREIKYSLSQHIRRAGQIPWQKK